MATFLLIIVAYDMVANPFYIEVGRKPHRKVTRKQSRHNYVPTYTIGLFETTEDKRNETIRTTVPQRKGKQ